MLTAGIFGAQRSNDDREGVVGGSDRKSRESDPGDLRQGGFTRRKALRVGGREVHHEADRPDRLMRQAADPEPADLDQARDGGRRPYQQPSVRRLGVNAVIADEPREGKGAG